MLHTTARISPKLAERRQQRRTRDLRQAVVELPDSTRRAMLTAIDRDELIVGAYTDRRGRICPMLAAHRRGARSDVGRFPRAWDAFARASRPRPATQRELQILRALLEEAVHPRRGMTNVTSTPSSVGTELASGRTSSSI
jgi:hypothetical protein